MYQSKSDKKLIDFLDDAIRFVDTDIETINLRPLQIYYSVLVFAPTNSIVRNTFTAELPSWMENVSGTRSDWDPHLRSFNDYNGVIGEEDAERSIVFSPDSKLLCSSTKERIRVWSCDTSECIEELKADEDPLMAISPNGKYLAVTTADAKRRLRVLFLGMIENTFELTQDTALGALAFSEDSAFLWACSIDGEVKVWNVETKKCVRELKWLGMFTRPVIIYAHWDCSYRLAFSLKAPKVLLISDRTNAYVWFLQSGEEGKSFHITFSYTNRNLICFSPDGKLLATPGTQGLVAKIWNVQSGECLWELDRNGVSFSKSPFPLSKLLFSPDSSLLAISYPGQFMTSTSILVWDMRSGACSANLDTGTVSALAFSPDMKFLVLALPTRLGETIQGWNLKTKALAVAKGCRIIGLRHLLFSQDGKLCISGGFDEEIQLWDWQSFLKEPLENPCEISSITLSHDASIVVVLMLAFGGQEMRAWDTATAEVLWELNTGNRRSWISSFEISPNSQRIAVTYREKDGSLTEVWKRVSGTFKLEQTWDSGLLDHITFSPSGNLLFGSTSSEIGILSCETGELVHQMELEVWLGGEVSTAIVEDSSILALGFELTVQIWDLKSMKRIHTWDTEFDRDLVLSSKGTLLASRPRGKEYMLLWNWATGEMVAEIEVLEVNWKFHAFLPDNSGVRTNHGDILLKPGNVSRQCLKPTFRVREGWIQWKGHNMVKLPTEYETSSTAIRETASEFTAVFGDNWQRCIIVKLSEIEELRRLPRLIGETV
jgi:WD40 repeat protein